MTGKRKKPCKFCNAIRKALNLKPVKAKTIEQNKENGKVH